MPEGSIRILTIDDEKYVRKSIRYFLEDCDYEVIEAANGRDGLAMLEAHQPHLVLVDLRMPEIDGLEVLRRITANQPELPVIVISGNGAMKDVVEALRLGAWDYLIKPIEDLSMLHHAIKKAFERSRLLTENRRYREHLEEEVTQRTTELKVANADLQQLNERLHGVVATTRRISALSRLDRFGARLLEEFGKHMSASGGSLYVVEDEHFHLMACLDPGHAAPNLPLPLNSGSVLHWAYQENKPLLIEDITNCPHCKGSGWPGYQTGSILVFPLVGQENQVLGLLSLHAGEAHPFTEEDKEIGAVLASYSGEALAAARASTAVAESEERKELALFGANLGMWDWDVATGTMLFDRRTEEMLGYQEGELNPTVDSWEAHVLAEDLPAALDLLDVHLKGHTDHFQTEYRVRCRDGQIRWIMDRGKVVARNEMGEALRVTGTHLDITDRKTAELALKQSEERSRSIIDYNPVPMIITEGDQGKAALNRAFREQFGYRADEIGSMDDFWSYGFPDQEARALAGKAWHAALAGDESALDLPDWRITRGDGSRRDVEVKLMALGDITVTALNDVTERRLAEQRVRELNSELSQRVKKRTAQLEATREKLDDATQRAGMADLATGTIHNIGNILSSLNVSTGEVSARLEKSKIKGLVVAGELLEKHAANLTEFLTCDEKGRQIPAYFLALGRKISQEYDHLVQEITSLNNKIDIMRDVITTQQDHAHKIDNNEVVAVVDLVEHAIKLQKHIIDKYGVSLKRAYLEQPSGSFPRVKLTHVLINLIKNACEAMADRPPSERQLEIRLGTEETLIFIAVSDRGCGISTAGLERLFQHGFTTKQDGHGFGLHTSYRWMKALGGTMIAASEGENKGATFTMYFPHNQVTGQIKVHSRPKVE